jgi:hypothetical protein
MMTPKIYIQCIVFSTDSQEIMDIKAQLDRTTNAALSSVALGGLPVPRGKGERAALRDGRKDQQTPVRCGTSRDRTSRQ